MLGGVRERHCCGVILMTVCQQTLPMEIHLECSFTMVKFLEKLSVKVTRTVLAFGFLGQCNTNLIMYVCVVWPRQVKVGISEVQ